MIKEQPGQGNRVLVVDDDAELCEMVLEYLTSRGFAVQSEGDGERGLQRALDGGFDLIILDVMLPGLEGLEVLRRLRENGSGVETLPVIMLTAHGDEADRVLGLELGADDYLSKPFSPRELLARMRAILRRSSSEAGRTASRSQNEAEAEAVRIQIGKVVMDIGARQVRIDKKNIELTASEFDVLRVLLAAAGRVISRDDLAKQGLRRHLTPFDRSLDIHVSNLRRKIGSDRIKTVRGVGYIYVKDAS